MVKITEDLIRKKAEHNEGLIGTLEELSLHQEDVEKIEHINNWCKEIQILYLQSNLISKIENLNKLKKLEYLNLAINNIEKVENLERCESLEKLDLTLNFIGDLQSVSSLEKNIHLKHLFLTGNPCCDFEAYREYVVARIPQLQTLDGTEITKSERIKARQNIATIEEKVRGAQERHACFRTRQKARVDRNDDQSISDEDFWRATSEHCPETRLEISRRSRKSKGLDEKEPTTKRQVSVFNKEGRPLNINQAKLNFRFSDEDPRKFILDLEVYKYLDTNLIEVDLQPIYVRITVKGKVFQIVFPEEILTDQSTARRSQTSGHLVLDMPRANHKALKRRAENKKLPKADDEDNKKNFLEVREKNDEMDISKIVENSAKSSFVDNKDVPPLEYA